MFFPVWLSSNLLSVSLVCFGSYFLHKVDASADVNEGLAKGFGEQIAWKTLDKGLDEAKSKQLPVMLIIHKSWCGACKALKPQFASSKEIHKLSEHLIMVNTGDDDEPKEKKYAPDGAYFPRILFLGPNGEVLTEYFNEQGHPQYKYYYSNPESIAFTMKKVVTNSPKRFKVPDEL
ncbi:thioredoxin domain-containing protein 12 [Nilaparvata lugens]|uniref:thioredoxin domain-containing protein 12 n=1 Tax=Nilaparvata lugens TaxID=108931 RepID=UPI00193D313A|nr:thioredoxin domain-containing protein 12 [Nilaparvata lugens]